MLCSSADPLCWAGGAVVQKSWTRVMAAGGKGPGTGMYKRKQLVHFCWCHFNAIDSLPIHHYPLAGTLPPLAGMSNRWPVSRDVSGPFPLLN